MVRKRKEREKERENGARVTGEWLLSRAPNIIRRMNPISCPVAVPVVAPSILS